jgi:hypothetical protein
MTPLHPGNKPLLNTLSCYLPSDVQAVKSSPEQIERLKREMLETDDKLDVLKSFVDKNIVGFPTGFALYCIF